MEEVVAAMIERYKIAHEQKTQPISDVPPEKMINIKTQRRKEKNRHAVALIVSLIKLQANLLGFDSFRVV